MSYLTSEDFAAQTGKTLRLLHGMIRRMAVVLTDGTLWRLLGQRGGQGGDETREVENFSGIGFYARPPSSGGNPEAIAVAVAGGKNMAIVATRDEATRQAVAGNIDEDETATFNSCTLIINKKNATVEIRLPSGTAVSLMLKSEGVTMRNELHNHTHGPGSFTAPSGGGPVTGTSGAGPAVTTPTGTTVLKGQ